MVHARLYSYDCLPNFTAMDLLRFLEIGRNQYIDIMNKARAKKLLWKMHKNVLKSFLPQQPPDPEHLNIDVWWTLMPVYSHTEDVVERCTPTELEVYQRLLVASSASPRPSPSQVWGCVPQTLGADL